jgi:probable O-glycosylation ligase (exosortase A-associated)
MGNSEKNIWLKRLLRVILAGDILALILTYSRGGLLGIIAVGFFILLRSKRKVIIFTFGLFLLLVFYTHFLPDEYKERIYTMSKYDIHEEDVDMSAAGRIIAWRMAIEMIKEHPLFGVGLYCSGEKIVEYTDPVTRISFDRGKALHNTVLQVAAEGGIPALLVYVLIYLMAYLRLTKIRRLVKPHGLDPKYWHYASMLQLAFVGHFSTGMFINAAYIDLPWHCVGLTVALEQIARKQLNERKQL